jgi:hypothetical protein
MWMIKAGAPMSEETKDEAQLQELTQLAEDLNEVLRASGASSAEQAFGLGCGLGLMPLVLIIGALLVFQVIHIILAILLVVMSSLIVVGITAFLSQRARQNGMERAFQTRVAGEIARYVQQTGMSRAQFDALVCDLLPGDAPLRAYLRSQDRSDK